MMSPAAAPPARCRAATAAVPPPAAQDASQRGGDGRHAGRSRRTPGRATCRSRCRISDCRAAVVVSASAATTVWAATLPSDSGASRALGFPGSCPGGSCGGLSRSSSSATPTRTRQGRRCAQPRPRQGCRSPVADGTLHGRANVLVFSSSAWAAASRRLAGDDGARGVEGGRRLLEELDRDRKPGSRWGCRRRPASLFAFVTADRQGTSPAEHGGVRLVPELECAGKSRRRRRQSP